jgi:Zn-dependent protease/predicted transcriptional regulator
MNSPEPARNSTEPVAGDQSKPVAPPSAALSMRLFGVPVRLHFTFLLFIAFLMLTARGGQSAVFNAIYIVAFFLSVLLHELGHAAVASRYAIRTLEIVMYPIGGVARLERSPKPKEELWIALAGPAVNVLITFALGAWLLHAGDSFDPGSLMNPTDSNVIIRIAIGNLILAAFNMIPAFPMDGGRVLRALIARYRSEEQATRIAAAAGRFFAVAMGLYGLIIGQFILLFIALFVYLAASQETAVVVGRTLTHGVPVRSAMITDFRTLEHGNTIRQAADMLLATSQTDFPVVLGEQVIGMLGRNALLRGMAVDGPEAYVAGIMDRNFARLNPADDLNEALPMMAATTCALVMEGEKLVGLLTRENLSEFLMLRRVGMNPIKA